MVSITDMRIAYSLMLVEYGPDFTYGFLRGLCAACKNLLEGDSDG